jgi:hypothetical protein
VHACIPRLIQSTSVERVSSHRAARNIETDWRCCARRSPIDFDGFLVAVDEVYEALWSQRVKSCAGHIPLHSPSQRQRINEIMPIMEAEQPSTWECCCLACDDDRRKRLLRQRCKAPRKLAACDLSAPPSASHCPSTPHFVATFALFPKLA